MSLVTNRTIHSPLNIFLTTVFCYISCVPDPVFDVQGHRGARGLLPENTLPGIELAMEISVSTIELDLGVTKDRQVVVAHDPYINPRLCLNADGSPIEVDSGGYGPFIMNLTLKEVQSFDCGSLNPDPARFPEPPRVNLPGTPIPTLQEVFDLAKKQGRNVRFNLELKIHPLYPVTVPDEKFVTAVLEIIRLNGMEGRVVIQSFYWPALERVRNLAPSIRTAALLGDDTYKSMNDSTPSPWLNGIDFHKSGGTSLGLLRAADAYVDIFSPHWALVVAEDSLFLGSTVKEIQNTGFEVIPWTVNDTETMAQLLDLGVDGIITDYPDRLMALIRERRVRVK